MGPELANTGDLLQVLRALSHPTLAQVHQALPRTRTPNLSTTYRRLESLTDSGFVRKTLVGRVAHYELGHEPRVHFVCRSCGRLRDGYVGDSFHELARTIHGGLSQIDAIGLDLEVNVSVLCPDCRNAFRNYPSGFSRQVAMALGLASAANQPLWIRDQEQQSRRRRWWLRRGLPDSYDFNSYGPVPGWEDLPDWGFLDSWMFTEPSRQHACSHCRHDKDAPPELVIPPSWHLR